MSIFSWMRKKIGVRSGSAKRSARVVRADIERCEALILEAAERGVPLPSTDITPVRSARRSLEQSTWTNEIDADFYAALARITSLLRYPGLATFDDLEDGLQLVSHAAQAGKLIAQTDIQALSEARQAQRDRAWTPAIEAAFYAATCRIASMVSPVIAETTGNEARLGARKAIKVYTLASIILTICVSLMSCVMFVVVQASQDISDIVKANDTSALSMHNELQAHAAMIVEAEKRKGSEGSDAIVALQNSQPALQIKQQLQQFVTNNRQLYADVERIKKLYGLIGLHIPSPYKAECPKSIDNSAHPDLYWPPNASFGLYGGAKAENGIYSGPKDALQPFHWPELSTLDWQCDPDKTRETLEITLPLLGDPVRDADDPLLGTSPVSVVQQGFQKIAVYQDIRAMAMYIHDIILSFVGAVTEFMLPILYASLGACAAILRQLSADCSANVFHPVHSKVTNRAHVITAVIVGITIGLFNDLVEGGKNASPLAVAFVAGYASDKFFHYLDRLVETLFPARVTTSSDAKDRPDVNSVKGALGKTS